MYFLFLCLTIYAITENQNLICLIHALITSIFSIMSIPHLLDSSTKITDNNSLGHLCAYLTFQYMIFDLFHVRKKIDFLLHHVLAITASIFVLYFRVYETLVLYIEINEISTIFLSLVYMDICKEISRFLFFISFICFRIIWLLWVLVNKNISNIFMLLLLYAHYTLQVYWLYRIYKTLVNKKISIT